MSEVLRDFTTKLPALTDWVCRAPWLVVVTPLVATVCGGLALVTGRRAPLVAAWMFAILGVAAILAAEVVLQLPMQVVMQSVMGK